MNNARFRTWRLLNSIQQFIYLFYTKYGPSQSFDSFGDNPFLFCGLYNQTASPHLNVCLVLPKSYLRFIRSLAVRMRILAYSYTFCHSPFLSSTDPHCPRLFQSFAHLEDDHKVDPPANSLLCQSSNINCPVLACTAER